MPQKDCFERRWTPHEKQIRLIYLSLGRQFRQS